MDNRPIGIYDSGFGGLTALKRLRQLMPDENIIYFADSGRMPYGGRSDEQLCSFAKQDQDFLAGFDVKIIIAACGTITTFAEWRADGICLGKLELAFDVMIKFVVPTLIAVIEIFGIADLVFPKGAFSIDGLGVVLVSFALFAVLVVVYFTCLKNRETGTNLNE